VAVVRNVVRKIKMKGQGLSLSTIVIAALVLIVLVILIVIFSGRLNVFGDAYDESDDEAKGRLCMNYKTGVCHDKTEVCPDGRTGDDKIDWIDCSKSEQCCYI